MSNNKKPIIAWDSCIFIHKVQADHPENELIQSMWDASLDGKILIVGSALVETEMLHFRGLSADESDKLLEEVLGSPGLHIEDVHHEVLLIARDNRRQVKHSTEDAIHIANAEFLQADVLLTFDTRTKGGNISPLGLSKRFGSPALPIMKPSEWEALLKDKEGPMFAGAE
jgi:predicted nucleic acid-binding protein